jgi:ABC-type lipoprotein release transport system permease subunit
MTRSLLISLTLMVGVLSIILVNSISDGLIERFIQNAISLELGDVVIQAKGYQNKKQIELSFVPKEIWLKKLKKIQNISQISFRLKAQGMAAIADRSEGVLITGLDPALEKNSHILFKKIKNGRGLEVTDLNGLMLGEALAKKLKLAVGDKIILMAQDYQGSIGSGAFRVTGIFNSGSPDFDKAVVLIHLGAAQKMLATGPALSQVILKLKDHTLAAQTLMQIRQEVSDSKLEILSWQEQMPILTTYRSLMDWAAGLRFTLMFLCVGICVVNVFVIAIFERTREFGVLMAIGTTPSQVLATLLVESLFIGIAGYAMGILSATLLIQFFQSHPIDLSAWSTGLNMTGFDTILIPVLNVKQYYFAAIAVTITTFLGSFLPGLRILNLKPVEALQNRE